MGLIRRSSIGRVAVLTAAVLLVPLVAMQFSDEVEWGAGDFLAAGALLVGAAITYLLLASRSQSVRYRVAVGAVVGAALVLVWAALAVGLS